MNLCLYRLGSLAWMLLLINLPLNKTFAATRTWTNTLGGDWRIGSTNWTAGQAPISSDDANINNASNKTVTVDAATPTTNLTVNSLTLTAPANTTNTLLLTDVTTNRP